MKRTTPTRIPADYPLETPERPDPSYPSADDTCVLEEKAVSGPEIAYAQLLERHRANLPITEAMIREATAQLHAPADADSSANTQLADRLMRLIQSMRRSD